MRVLVTIESVEIVRKVQRQDGTWGNVYGVIMVSGDDRILAECWRSDEGMKKAGIVPGGIGTAQLEFKVSRGVSSRTGQPYLVGNTTLRHFDIPNQNMQQAAPAEAAPTPETPAPGAEEGNADGVNF